MQAIQAHFRELGRDPTDVELETIAQTWSRALLAQDAQGHDRLHRRRRQRHYDNLLKETIFGATQEIRQRLGADDWCVSVFEDNAGVVRSTSSINVCFKVETHNHPSAIEPYGGANTGLGGVIRDLLGTGLGAKPICNTDVFCFAPPDTPPEQLPPGVLHPRRVMQGVVAGVRDYGNRMGIPTVNGAVCFDDALPRQPARLLRHRRPDPARTSRSRQPQPGDLIVAVGGRTGRDGIHGATFSSLELTARVGDGQRRGGADRQRHHREEGARRAPASPRPRPVSRHHRLRRRRLQLAPSARWATSSAPTVDLDKAPLKYEGLSYTEIWISEAQERMVLAVPPANWAELAGAVRAARTSRRRSSARSRRPAGCGCATTGNAGRRPGHALPARRPAAGRARRRRGQPPPSRADGCDPPAARRTRNDDPARRSSPRYNVCSKEWIIRQYDHEVQGGSVVKPLVGVAQRRPRRRRGRHAGARLVDRRWRSAAASTRATATSTPTRWPPRAIDEAVRNVVAVGADPTRIALLDNFCWGNTDRPEVLGSLVRAAEACRDVALAFGMPFISGKDSLNNEFRAGGRHIVIPPTLLISAMGRVPDVRRCVTMDLKEPGNVCYLVGDDEATSWAARTITSSAAWTGGEVPQVDWPSRAADLPASCTRRSASGLVRACHDLSEGGLAVAAGRDGVRRRRRGGRDGR